MTGNVNPPVLQLLSRAIPAGALRTHVVLRVRTAHCLECIFIQRGSKCKPLISSGRNLRNSNLFEHWRKNLRRNVVSSPGAFVWGLKKQFDGFQVMLTCACVTPR